MNVKLLAHTPEAEKIIATAAKLCYSSSDIGSLKDGLTDEKVEGFVSMLASIGHESVMEHVSFTFGIEGISRACSHQLVRHRIASYSQKSQRYVNENGFEFITPPEIAADEAAKAEFDKQMAAITESYNKIADILTQKHTKTFLEQGLDEKEARSKAQKKDNEDARAFLTSLDNMLKNRLTADGISRFNELLQGYLNYSDAIGEDLGKFGGAGD